jgi:hypothetical protein
MLLCSLDMQALQLLGGPVLACGCVAHATMIAVLCLWSKLLLLVSMNSVCCCQRLLNAARAQDDIKVATVVALLQPGA